MSTDGERLARSGAAYSGGLRLPAGAEQNSIEMEATLAMRRGRPLHAHFCETRKGDERELRQFVDNVKAARR